MSERQARTVARAAAGALSPADPMPLYYQLEMRLREAIETGAFSGDNEFPAENELARLHGVSRVTVRKALERLEEDGLILRRQGRGTQVNALRVNVSPLVRNPESLLGFEAELQQAGINARIKYIGSEVGPGPHSAMKALKLPEGREIWRIRRIGFDGLAPLWLETRYYPVHLRDILLEPVRKEISVSRVLAKHGIPLTGASWQLEAVQPTPRQAKLLRIANDQPVLHGQFTDFCNQMPVQFGDVVFVGDRYRITAAFGTARESDEPA